MQLSAERVMSLHVELGEARVVGRTPEGVLTIIPITGGSFEGPRLKGRVCAGGADWNTARSETICRAHARYWIETDDGAVISVENEGDIDTARKDAVIRTTPRFRCDLAGRYAFLAKDTFAGELRAGAQGSVDIIIYRLD